MKRLTALCLMLMLFATAACGGDSGGSGNSSESSDRGSDKGSESSSDSGKTIKADVYLKEAGYLDGNLFAYVENRENREVAVEVQYTAFDATGGTVDLSDIGGGGYDILPPSSTTLVARSGKNDVVRVTADVRPISSTGPEHGDGNFEVVEIRRELISIPYSMYVTFKNNFPQAVDNAAGALMCEDKAGNRVAVGIGRFSAPAGGTGEARFGVNAKLAENIGECEPFARITSTTTFG